MENGRTGTQANKRDTVEAVLRFCNRGGEGGRGKKGVQKRPWTKSTISKATREATGYRRNRYNGGQDMIYRASSALLS